MRLKYVEEMFPRYFIFGVYDDGRVDVCTVNGHVATVTKKEADTIISDRDKLIDKLFNTAESFDHANPVQFTRFWYGKFV